jgi:protein-L-isoaspartate(D-aspartate) O-methyltransferase
MEEFAAARTKMVDSQLRTVDVTDYGILAAMGEIARERFVPARMKPLAYIDEDILIKEAAGGHPARYLMEPGPLARLIQLAEVQPTDAVLDVGCGTGYSTAVLARLAKSVVAVESDQELSATASQTLAEIGAANAAVVTGPLEAGYASKGPYDAIFVDGAMEVVPDPLLAQLKDGGRLVGVVGYGQAAVATLFTRSGDEVGRRVAFNAHVRPLPGFARPKAFVF